MLTFSVISIILLVSAKGEISMGKELGNKILKLLNIQKMTQKDLAATLNTTEATISRYVSGDRDPKAEVLANIATALHTTSDYLLGIENNDEFDVSAMTTILARNSNKISENERKLLIKAIFGEV